MQNMIEIKNIILWFKIINVQMAYLNCNDLLFTV